jgi:hypothetical protein
MQLIMHTGAHYTEQDRLIKSLLRNKGMLKERGIMVPGPGSYRGLVRDTLNAMNRAPAAEGARDVLLDVILDDATAERVVLSDPNFFRTPGTAVQKGEIYPAAAVRMKYMSELFPDDDLEIFIGLRNPATFLPIVHNVAIDGSDAAFWGARTAYDLRWSEVIAGIRQSVPHIPITFWCSEDLPLIWSQILRELAGLELHESITGEFDLLSTIMSKEGMQRLRSYLKGHPDITEIQKRRVIAAFLDKFALDDEIEEEIDMAGWTDALVDDLTEQYDEDVLAIQRMPGVTMIAP